MWTYNNVTCEVDIFKSEIFLHTDEQALNDIGLLICDMASASFCKSGGP